MILRVVIGDFPTLIVNVVSVVAATATFASLWIGSVYLGYVCSVAWLSLSQVNVNEFVAIPTVLLPANIPWPAPTVTTILPVRAL